MKRLLSEIGRDIYQISHVFRDGERGVLHQPEFVMVEWYRIGFTLDEMIEETLAFLKLFIDAPLKEKISYSEAFQIYGGKDLCEVVDKDHFFAFEVEPSLGRSGFTVLTDFPADQAALSAVVEKEGRKVAMRFEVLFEGVELANGYLELINPSEQRARLNEENLKRKKMGKATYPVDEAFVAALEEGIPPCTGVAVGFDRLMMFRNGCTHIEEVVALPWL